MYWLIIIVVLFVAIKLTPSKKNERTEKKPKRTIPKEELPTEVRKALEEGTKLQAIKIYKELTGCSLKEAKDYIDSVQIK